MPFGLAAIKGIKGFLGADNALKSPTITKAGNCFVAGTEILTVDGIKNIEDIQVGDWVIADDPTTPGGIEAKQVLDTFVRETSALVDLYVDGEVISTTGEHPLWVADKGWVKASDLAVGDLLQTDEDRNNVELCINGAAEIQTRLVQILTGADADLNLADNDGKTALMLAAEFGSPEAVSVLIQKGANIDRRDDRGNTALTYAEKNDCLLSTEKIRRSEIIKLLLEAGAIEDSVYLSELLKKVE